MKVQKSHHKTDQSKAANPTLTKSVEALYKSVAEILAKARTTVYRAVNVAMVQAYWEIGRVIVAEEQKGKKRADYGKAILVELSRKLTRDFGGGFDERNLRYIRQFYLTFPIRNALRSELSWPQNARELSLKNAFWRKGRNSDALQICTSTTQRS